MNLRCTCIYVSPLDESNARKTSSDIGRLSIQLEIYCISYTPPMILNGLFIKLSKIPGYWTVCHIENFIISLRYKHIFGSTEHSYIAESML